MKTKKLLYLLLFVLIIGACQSRETTPGSVREMVDQLQQDMVSKHLNHNLTQFHLQDQPIASSLSLLSVDRTEVPLDDLGKTSTMLIFRYSEIHCNTCIDLVVQKMNERYEAGFTQMAIVANYSEYRHFASFVRANKLQMPVYLMKDEDAEGIFDTDIPPYLFVLDESMQIKYPFVPIKEMETGIDMYLDFAHGKLGESDQPISLNIKQ